jgi:D-alanyl-D-alanine carboxypeptidase
MKHVLCAIIALASVSLVLGTAASATTPSRTAQLRGAVDHTVATGVPGVILLARDGNRTIRVTGGYGTLETKAPMRATDRFRVGSLTKTFVSTVALQLADEGTLSLDDSVEHWLPGVVPNGSNISVRELLNMRSGLYDYLNENTVIVKRFRAGDVLHRYTPLELVRIATAKKPYFAPGARWHYCNTCYILVGLIVEKATGHPIATELEQRIFKPLKLRDTTFDTQPAIAGPHAHGYIRLGKRLRDVSVVSPTPAGASGAIVSTVDDLDRFFTALNSGRLLQPKLLRDMTTGTPASNGYGLGYARKKVPCGTMFWNNGNYVGFNATAFGSPGGDRQVVLFVNIDEESHTAAVLKSLNRVLNLAVCGKR